MTHAEQHGMILELKDYDRGMNRKDRDEFDVFVRRDKDDEDLDEISAGRLISLYKKYVPERKRNY